MRVKSKSVELKRSSVKMALRSLSSLQSLNKAVH